MNTLNEADQSGEKKKVSLLVVEDELDFAEILVTELEKFPFECQSTDSFVEAASRLQNQKFYAIILDLQIKRGSGEDLILRVRKDSKHMNHETPIIVVSGNLEPNLAKRIAPYVDAMLVKPFPIPDFCRTVIEKVKSGSRFRR